MSADDELFIAWSLDGETTAPDALDARLRADPATARRFAAFCAAEMALFGTARRHVEDPGSASARRGVAAPARRGDDRDRPSRGGSARRPRARSARAAPSQRRSGVAMAIALVAVLAVVGAWSLQRPTPVATAQRAPTQATPVTRSAVVHEVVGELRAGARALRAGDVVPDGEPLTSAADARCTLAWPDGTRVALSDGVAATLRWPEIRLDGGTLVADVAPQAATAPLTIRTAQALTVVVGTRFTVRAGADATWLAVDHGQVRFARADRSADAREVVAVGAGAGAEARAGERGAPTTYPLDDAFPPLPAQATVRWRAAGIFAGWTGAGRRPPSGAGGPTIASAPPTEGDYAGEIRTPMDARWTVTPRSYLRFRYRLDGAGTDPQLKFMLKREDQLNYGGWWRVQRDRWTTVTLRLDEGIPLIEGHDASLAPGEVIRQIAWLVRFGDGARPDAALWLSDAVVFDVPTAIPADAIDP